MNYPREKVYDFIRKNKMVVADEIVDYLKSEGIELAEPREYARQNIRFKLTSDTKFKIVNMTSIKCADGFNRNAYSMPGVDITPDMINRIKDMNFSHTYRRISSSVNDPKDIKDIVKEHPSITGKEVLKEMGIECSRKNMAMMRGRLMRMVKNGRLNVNKDMVENRYYYREVI